jgi:NDP-sugar pyrophosphorylase family protein
MNWSHINDNSKPLVLVGSNSALFFIQDICDQHGIKIHGIIDSDYYGNTDDLHGIPVVDTELSFNDTSKLAEYKEKFNFFLATNWQPDQNPISEQDRNKRKMLMTLIDQFDLPCISLVDRTAIVQKTNVIGKSVLIDALVYISAENIIEDFVGIYANVKIGYKNVIKRNSILQRSVGFMHRTLVEENVYFSLNVNVFVSDITFGEGTVIHPCLCMGRGTSKNEVVSLAGKDLRRIYNQTIIN